MKTILIKLEDCKKNLLSNEYKDMITFNEREILKKREVPFIISYDEEMLWFEEGDNFDNCDYKSLYDFKKLFYNMEF